MLSATRLLARTLVACATITICCAAGAGTGTAAAATYVVAPSGSNAASGTSGAPFRTISQAAAHARTGDTVEVRAGRYAEAVTLTSRNRGAEFRAAEGDRPVVDGDGTRAYGFENTAADDVTIRGFEITGQTGAGIYTRGERNVIAGNTIHHVGVATEAVANGIRVSRGHGSRIAGNTVHHIGPGAQSIGLWVLETRDARVSQNTVYMVRKEGIRDWKGLDNEISGNRTFLNWVGLSLNTSTGSSLTGNFAYDNVEGIVVKHQSYRTVLDLWDLDRAHWSTISGNTVYRSTETSLWLGQSDAPMDYVDVRDNLFSGAGTAFVRDSPSLRGPNVTVDANSYSNEGGRPSWVYKAGWRSDPGLDSWDEVRAQLGWESHPAARSLSLTQPGTTPATDVTWTPYAMTPVDSSSKGTYYTRTHLDKTADNNQNSYWMTATGEDEYVTYDFGQRRTFDHLILTVYSHEDLRNVRGYRFEVSDDGRNWTGIRAGVNPDAAGSAYPYELDRPRTGRYLRFTMVDNFCESYAPRRGCGEGFVLSDLKAGMLGGPTSDEDAPAPAPAGPAAPSAAGSPAPAPVDAGPQAHAPAAGAPAKPGSGTPARPARATVRLSRRAKFTARGRLALGIRCTGVTAPVRASVAIAGFAGSSVRLQPRCRSLNLRVPAALARRVRAGKRVTVRVTVRLPGAPSRSARVRISR